MEKQFKDAVKQNDLEKIKGLLNHDYFAEQHLNNLKSSALKTAIKRQNVKMVKLLLRCMSEEEFKTTGCKYVLYEVIKNGNIDLLNIFVECFGVNLTNENGISALHIATENEITEVVDFLLKKGADVASVIIHGENALTFAAKVGNIELMKVFVQNGADLNMANEYYQTALHYAAWYEYFDVVLFLVKNGAAIDAQDWHGNTPLHNAVFNKSSSMIELLLACCANMDLLDSESKSPFHHCIETCNDNVTSLFLKYNANVAVQNGKGKNALHLAVVHYSSYNIINGILELNVVDVNETDFDGKTPLHLLLDHFGDFEKILAIVTLLVKHGAKVNQLDRFFYSPLHYAVKINHLEVIRYLISRGAYVNCCEFQESLLEVAFSCSVPEVVEILIINGADLGDNCASGQSVINRVIEFVNNDESCFNIIKLLLEKGVDLSGFDLKNVDEERFESAKVFELELKEIKKVKVCNEINVTYYDVLVNSTNQLVNILRYEAIRDELKSENYKQMFVHFANRLEAKYLRGLNRFEMLKQYEIILLDILGCILPYDLIHLLCNYFSDEDLQFALSAQQTY